MDEPPRRVPRLLVALGFVAVAASLLLNPTSAAADDDTVTVVISANADDAEQRPDYWSQSSLDLDLKSGRHTGLRFRDVCVDAGRAITSATLTLVATESDSQATTLTIAGHAVGDAPAFGSTNKLTGLPLTSARTTMSAPSWSWGNSYDHDVTAVLQELLARSDWDGCGSVALVLTSTGERVAVSREKHAADAARLTITMADAGPPPPAPTVTEIAVGHNHDDAEERPGYFSLTSTDLDLKSGRHTGLRFRDVCLEPGHRLTSASITLTADESHSGSSTLTFAGNRVADAPLFGSSTGLAALPQTTAKAVVAAAPWQWGQTYDHDVTDVVDELLGLPGRTECTNMAFIITSSATRVAVSRDHDASKAAVLTLVTEPMPVLVDVSSQSVGAAAVSMASGDQAVGAYTVEVAYDPNEVDVTDCSGVDGTCNTDTPGVVLFSATVPAGRIGDQAVGTITYDAVEAAPADAFAPAVQHAATPQAVRLAGMAPAGGGADLPGDVNCDFSTDIVDALLIAQLVVGNLTDTGACPTDRSRGDVNGDGIADVVDALLIAQCEVRIPNLACPTPPSITFFADALLGEAANSPSTSLEVTWELAGGPRDMLAIEVWLDGELHTSFPTTTTRTVITGLAPGSTHEVGVYAIDRLGHRIGNEVIVARTHHGNQPPTAPSLSFATSATTIRVDWTHPSGPVDDVGPVEYRVLLDGERLPNALDAATSSFTITDLWADTTYTVQVLAIDGDGNVTPSATSTVTTAPSPVIAPPPTDIWPPEWNKGGDVSTATYIEVVDFGQDWIELEWWGAGDWPVPEDIYGVQSGLHGYDIYVDHSPTPWNDELIVGPVGFVKPTFRFDGFQPGTTYTIQVIAVDFAGNRSVDGPRTTVTTASPAPAPVFIADPEPHLNPAPPPDPIPEYPPLPPVDTYTPAEIIDVQGDSWTCTSTGFSRAVGQDQVRLKWSTNPAGADYFVFTMREQENRVSVGNPRAVTLIEGLPKATTFTRLRPETNYVITVIARSGNTDIGSCSMSARTSSAPPLTNHVWCAVQVAVTEPTEYFSWRAVTGTDFYHIEVMTVSGADRRLVFTLGVPGTETSVETDIPAHLAPRLQPNLLHEVSVTAYDQNQNLITSCSRLFRPAPPTGLLNPCGASKPSLSLDANIGAYYDVITLLEEAEWQPNAPFVQVLPSSPTCNSRDIDDWESLAHYCLDHEEQMGVLQDRHREWSDRGHYAPETLQAWALGRFACDTLEWPYGQADGALADLADLTTNACGGPAGGGGSTSCAQAQALLEALASSGVSVPPPK